MNRRSFLARFVGGLAAISLKLEELPKAGLSKVELFNSNIQRWIKTVDATRSETVKFIYLWEKRNGKLTYLNNPWNP